MQVCGIVFFIINLIKIKLNSNGNVEVADCYFRPEHASRAGSCAGDY